MQPAATGKGRCPTTAALDGSPRSRHLPMRQTTHLKDSERDRGKTDFKDAAFQTRHLVTVPRWTRGARRPRPCHCGGEAAGSAHSTRPATARAGGPCARLQGRAGSAPAAGAGGMRAPDAAGRRGRRRRLPCNGHASLGWRDPANLADAGQEVAGGRRQHLSQPGTATAGQAPRRPAEGRGEPRRQAHESARGAGPRYVDDASSGCLYAHALRSTPGSPPRPDGGSLQRRLECQTEPVTQHRVLPTSPETTVTSQRTEWSRAASADRRARI